MLCRGFVTPQAMLGLRLPRKKHGRPRRALSQNNSGGWCYSWIGRPVRTHEKSICRESKRATADLNIRMNSSRQGASTGAA